jgi:hypothetical protein
VAPLKQCEFFVLRYIPDLVRNEPINIGVLLLEDGAGGFADVRFTHDWHRVRCADPQADIELLESFEPEFRRLLQSQLPEIINYREPMWRREWLLGQMQQSFSGALDLAAMKAVLTESPAVELGVLAHRYLESTLQGPSRAQSGRRAIFNTMRDAFEHAGVWQFMRKNIEVAPYTHPGDPLKIDCGYRPNGVLHLFHALSLATDVNSAKVLTFSYSEMAEKLHQAENAMSTLTAITEDGLDRKDEGVAFAFQTLQDIDIKVESLSRMPAIAEQARIELKL